MAGKTTYKGMVKHTEWRRTAAHKHTSYYGCAKCGYSFRSPHEVYRHLDTRHA